MKEGAELFRTPTWRTTRQNSDPAYFYLQRISKIVGMPMSSSGGVLLHQMMRMIEDKPIAAMGFQSVEAGQLMTEVEKRPCGPGRIYG
jgi:gamma-glutamyltranspeptidase/glutathione hydrolase